jgi:2-dehydropantoate 2-reductase
MKIAVYGAGGVGGYFGGRLARAGADVHLIARGAHLEALRRDGLTVHSARGDFHVALPATDDPGDIGRCDYVFFCVKSFDTEDAATRSAPLIAEKTAVLSLQNGVDNEEKLVDALGERHVMGGAAYIFSTIESPGVIAHTGGPASIAFGELDGSRSERALQLLDMCLKAGIDARISDDIRADLWDKFAFICAQAGMTSAVRLPIGDIRSIAESMQAFSAIVAEVCKLAHARGVELRPDTVDRHTAFAQQLEPGGYSSLHHDLTHGNRMELEALHGTIVRLAHAHGLQVPVSEVVYAILKPWAARNEALAGRVVARDRR